MTKASTLSVAANIFRCNELKAAGLMAEHPCRRFATAAAAPVPEPWRGDIEHAPLLFVLPNAVFDGKAREPYATQDHAQIASHYCSPAHASLFPPTPLWRSIGRCAMELYGRSNISAGDDFAVTGLVHCRTNRQISARTLTLCAKRHLANVLAVCRAEVIACFGESVRAAVEDCIVQNNGLLPYPTPLVIGLPFPRRRQTEDAASRAHFALPDVRRRLCNPQLAAGAAEAENGGNGLESQDRTSATAPSGPTGSLPARQPACLGA